ncbi:GTPase [Vibrio sp. Vb1018]|uniref:GTPase n=1 Tax=Vibrio sp. Vb1018 TaxID=3074636 RepID=UPI0029650526|nr:GTPase [Vibrio sp. Vb1018]MDW1821577.1 GTPase [Vibrio sp. Vb1018]
MSDSLFVALDRFESDYSDISDKEDLLIQYKSELQKNLSKVLNAKYKNINNKSLLYRLAEDLKNSVESSIRSWDIKLEESLPMKALSDEYTDRIILLVYGKVNAGKSSFCNFLAKQFSNDQIKYFVFKNGSVNYFEGEFSEGVTETTAQIQGVELGNNLVLLDSPGLHSVVDENGDLTRRFTDSADAVLWLSPSSSPGQVQELEELRVELEKLKPLQPVLTRSDEIEEDYCEEIDDIIGILKNKSKSRRKAQENDVFQRVNDLNLKVEVSQPISISVHAYEKYRDIDNAMKESGLEKLLVRLVEIVEEAKDYKVNKANKQVVNFLEHSVLGPLNENVVPIIDDLIQQTNKAISSLKSKQESMTATIVSNVICEVPLIVEKHVATNNKSAISNDINSVIEFQVNQALEQSLSQYVSKIRKNTSKLSGNSIGEFEDVTIDIVQTKGSVKKSLVSSAGGISGAAGGAYIGSLIMPGVGTAIGGVIGGLVGGYAGDSAGEYFVETETIKEKVGVSTDKMIVKITKTIEKILPSDISMAFEDVNSSISEIRSLANNVKNDIDRFDSEVNEIKGK